VESALSANIDAGSPEKLASFNDGTRMTLIGAAEIEYHIHLLLTTESVETASPAKYTLPFHWKSAMISINII